MSVNLQKGQKVNLKKSDGGRLKRVIVGLGWDEAEQNLVVYFQACLVVVIEMQI